MIRMSKALRWGLPCTNGGMLVLAFLTSELSVQSFFGHGVLRLPVLANIGFEACLGRGC